MHGRARRALTLTSDSANLCNKNWKWGGFSKCDYFGDPHFKRSFNGKEKYDMMGVGAFLAAGSASGFFEVQNFHCPRGSRPHATLAVEQAIRFGSHTVVISADKSLRSIMWLDKRRPASRT